MIFNVGAGGASNAESIKYDNKNSGLKATNVQGAINEVNNSVNEVNDSLESLKYQISTSERVIGKFGNKDIYEKSYYANNLNATSRTTIDSSLKNSIIDMVLSLEEVYFTNNGDWSGSYFYTSSGGENKARCIIQSDGVKLDASGRPVNAYCITIKYTKK